MKSVFFAFAPAVQLPASSESGDSESDEDCADDRIGFIWLCQQGLEEKESVHQQNERFSLVQVKVRVSK